MHPEDLRTLYRSEEVWIQRCDCCDCGVFHVHVGATTLRFSQAAFEDFISGLGQAMSREAMWRFSGDGVKMPGSA